MAKVSAWTKTMATHLLRTTRIYFTLAAYPNLWI